MRKARSTANGVERTEAQDTIGDQPSSPARSRSPATARSPIASSDSPLQTAAESPALAMPPPTNPPISACEEDDGMPNPQVIRFQTMAPTRAAKITWLSMIAGFDDAGTDGMGDVEPNTVKATKLKNAARTPRNAAAAPASRRWSRSNWRRRAVR